MPAKDKKKYMPPFIISASELSFILLFFFIIVGSGAQSIDRIDMPFKNASTTTNSPQAPVRAEIYAESPQGDSSHMALIYEGEKPDTLFLIIGRADLAEADAFTGIRDNIAGFIAAHRLNPDSTSVDIYSSAYSYYGLVAITLAACNQLEYPCNLVYRTEEN